RSQQRPAPARTPLRTAPLRFTNHDDLSVKRSCSRLNWTKVHCITGVMIGQSRYAIGPQSNGAKRRRVSSLFCGEVVHLGGRNVESSNCRSDCTLRLRFVRNSPLTSLLARGKCDVVR